MFVVLHLVSRINGHYRDGCTSSLMQHIQVSVLHCKGDNTLRLSKLNCCLKIELHRTCKKVANSCTAVVLQLYRQRQVMYHKLFGFSLPIPVAVMRP